VVPPNPADEFSLDPNARVKIWGAEGIFWFYSGLYGFYGVIGIWLLVAGATEKDGTAPFVTGIFITAMSIPLYAMVFGVFVRPLIIDQGVLKIPTMFGHRDLSLRSLSGIGLVYRILPRTSGWTLQIWSDGNQPIQIRRFTVTNMRNPKLASGVKRRIGVVRDWTIPLPKENAKILSSTRSGRAATAIFQSAMSLQGTAGPLVHSAKQKSLVYDPNSLSKTLAWWSPDGFMGRAKGLPAPDSAKLADPSQCDVAAIPSDVGLAGVGGGASLWGPINAISQPLPDVVPQVSPEVQKARKRNLYMTFASTPFFIAIALAFVLLLGRQGLLANGEVCAAVMGPASAHPSIACNAWRHHQLVTFVWIGSLLALGLIATIVFQFRAFRHFVRTSKAAAVSTDDLQ
jgi:hypothetical protein